MKSYDPARALAHAGYQVEQIANDIGMSPLNLHRDMRFRDPMKATSDGQKRPRPVTKQDRSFGLDRERPARYMGTADGPVRPGLGKTSENTAVISVTSVGNGVTVAQQTLTLFV